MSCTRARLPAWKEGGICRHAYPVSARGIAGHINAFNFSSLGLLEKFAPAFLQAVPWYREAANSTSFLTEALVRQIDEFRHFGRGQPATGDR